jgi:putative transposase
MGTDPIFRTTEINRDGPHFPVNRKRSGAVLTGMPRKARLILPGVAVHVVQRGNNRGLCFFRESDYFVYLGLLNEYAALCGCEVHAYCLMTNHVHLLLTPRDAECCARLMKNVGQNFAQHVNRITGRTGTLWEGRFRSCIVANGQYALACYRYIELNPVRAGMAPRPEDYTWSSYCANAGLREDSLLVRHPAYLALADLPPRRAQRYAELISGGLEQNLIDDIRDATRNSRLLGQRRPPRGRPRKMGSVPIYSRT